MMNRKLAAAFGHLPPNPEMVKEAACRDMFSKLAAEDGVDLAKMSDADVANEYAVFRGHLKVAEIEDAKTAEMTRVARLLARIVPVALFEKNAAEAPSPFFSDFMGAIRGRPGMNPEALQAAFTPESIISRSSTGLLTPKDAGDMGRAAGYPESLVKHIETEAEKAWRGGGAVASPGAWKSYQDVAKSRLSPMTLEEFASHGGGAAKAEGLLSKLSPMGLGEAVSKGQWGRAAGKIAPIGAALMAGKWLMNKRRENQMAAQQAMSAPPSVAMAGF